ncbi:MAG: ATP-binding protein [Streptosporangiales bacterium]|nr:ATP-binding protein [Streptosporangiales bacterium]
MWKRNLAAYVLRTQPATVAVEQARDFVDSRLGEWALSDLAEQVGTIAVELVANAVRHAGTPLELRLHRGDGYVLVEVVDHDLRMPQLISVGPEDERGRGLHIVQALSVRWGATPAREGKVVWAEVEADSHP